jgi:hypothetical protein
LPAMPAASTHRNNVSIRYGCTVDSMNNTI